MSDTVIVIGYLVAVVRCVEDLYPDVEVLVIEDADVVSRVNFTASIDAAPRRRLVLWPYPEPSAADAFYHAHRDLSVRAVIPGVEYGVAFGARLSERYGIPGASLGAAQLLRDKALLRAVTGSAGIANPAYERVENIEQVRDFVRRHPGPVVIKPANRQGSVGTQIVRDTARVDEAWSRSLEQPEAQFVAYDTLPLRMLIEEFVEGAEFSVEMLLRCGRSLFANVTRKLLHPGDRPVELGHVVPADIADELTETLIAATIGLIDVVGFDTGVVHCEWIVRDGVPYLVECAGRMPGDGIVELIERAWPIDLIRRYVIAMSGGESEPAPLRALGGAAVLYPAVPPGIVESIEGIEEAQAVPGIYQSVCVRKVGERVDEMRSSWDRVVGAAAHAASPAEALAAAQTAIDKITIKTIPDA